MALAFRSTLKLDLEFKAASVTCSRVTISHKSVDADQLGMPVQGGAFGQKPKCM